MQRAPAARAAAGAADARALPLGPPGRGARGLPGRAARARRRARDRAGQSAARAEQAILAPGSRARARRADEPATEAGRGVFVGREAELAQLLAGLDDARRGPRTALPARRRARHRQEPARRGGDRRAREHGARRCSSAAAGRRVARRRTGRGCSRCAAYVRDAEPDALRASSAPAPPSSRRSCPSCATLLPGLPEPDPLDVRGRAVPPVRRDGRVPPQRVRDAGRRCSSWTICTPPTRRRCCCCSSSPASSARRACSSSAPTATSIRFPAHALTAMLAEVAREPVDPSPLARRAERERRGGVRRADGVGDRVARSSSPALHERDRGESALRRRDGAPARARGRWRPGDVQLAIPQSVRDVIARRLAHLSEECNRVLVLASVLGREFALDALARSAASREDELLETLDEAMAARVVSDVPGAAAVDSASPTSSSATRSTRGSRPPAASGCTGSRSRRSRTLYGDEPGPHLAELAHHAIAGSDFDKGLVYARRAGRPRAGTARIRGGGAAVRAALEALDLRTPRTSGRAASCSSRSARRKRGQGTSRRGEDGVPRGRRTSRDASDSRASSPGRPRGTAGGSSGRAPRSDDRLVPLLEEGLAALADEDVELRARLLARLAGALRDEPRATAATSSATRRSSSPPCGERRGARLRARRSRGGDHRPRHDRECLELATELRTWRAARRHRAHRGLASLPAHGEARARRGLGRSRRFDRRRPDCARPPTTRAPEGPARQEMMALAMGNARRRRGADPAGLRARRARARVHGDSRRADPALHPLRVPRRACGDGLRYLRLAAAYPARPVFRCVLSHLYAGIDRQAEAQRVLDEFAIDDFASLPFDQEWLYGISMLAETASRLGDVASSEGLYRLLAPWASRNTRIPPRRSEDPRPATSGSSPPSPAD